MSEPTKPADDFHEADTVLEPEKKAKSRTVPTDRGNLTFTIVAAGDFMNVSFSPVVHRNSGLIVSVGNGDYAAVDAARDVIDATDHDETVVALKWVHDQFTDWFAGQYPEKMLAAMLAPLPPEPPPAPPRAA